MEGRREQGGGKGNESFWGGAERMTEGVPVRREGFTGRALQKKMTRCSKWENVRKVDMGDLWGGRTTGGRHKGVKRVVSAVKTPTEVISRGRVMASDVEKRR